MRCVSRNLNHRKALNDEDCKGVLPLCRGLGGVPPQIQNWAGGWEGTRLLDSLIAGGLTFGIGNRYSSLCLRGGDPGASLLFQVPDKTRDQEPGQGDA